MTDQTSPSVETFKLRFNVSHYNFFPMTPHSEPFSSEKLKARMTREDMPVWYADHPLKYMDIKDRVEWLNQQEVNKERKFRNPHLVYRPTKVEDHYDFIKAKEGKEMWSLVRMLMLDIQEMWGTHYAPDTMTRLHLVDGTDSVWRDEVPWELGTLKAFKNHGTLHVTYEEPSEYSERWG